MSERRYYLAINLDGRWLLTGWYNTFWDALEQGRISQIERYRVGKLVMGIGMVLHENIR